MGHAARLSIAIAAVTLGVLVPGAGWAAAATIDVTIATDTVADDGECSLREAVTATGTNANVNGPDDCAHPGGTLADVIQLDSATTYELTGTPGEDENLNASGDLDIDANTAGPTISGALTLDGAGAASTVIDANDIDRVIDLRTEGASALTIEGTTLRDGRAPISGPGGAIKAEIPGLAVDLVLDGSVVTSNETRGSDDGRGGGIALSGGAGSELDLIESTISDNLQGATGQVGTRGGGIEVGGQVGVELTDSIVTRNVNAGNEGGGIVVGAIASLSATRSRITDNQVVSTGLGDPVGGGIYWGAVSDTQELDLTDTEVSGNSAPGGSGGGIYRASFFNLATLRMDGVTVAGNSAEFRGGIETAGVNEIVNTTISGNRSTGTGGFALGGGIALFDDGLAPASTLDLRHSTITGNSAAGSGDAIFQAAGSILEVGNTIFENDPTDGDANDACGTGGVVNNVDQFFNIDDGTSCGFGNGDGNQSSTNAQLGPLGHYGGPTRTHELPPGSPAVDVGPEEACYTIDGPPDDIVVDQRDFPRRFNGFCDAGAYELNAVCQNRGVTILTTTGPDSIVGTPEADVVSGGLGGDQIDGGGGDDRLCGDAGDDTITGGAGADQLLGGIDGDALFARDGAADSVNCDLGTDSAQTDRLSLDSVSGCETVDASAEPSVVPPPTTETGQRAAALRKCKKIKSKKKRKKCRRRANRLPL